ncbi:hypothetical protein JNUCC42_07120 [Brevibacterium sp. JNUCC-42]|nr:hypothetical protein JNUCC42_07120 [Brevibacterium sp. JNUCC-42]
MNQTQKLIAGIASVFLVGAGVSSCMNSDGEKQEVETYDLHKAKEEQDIPLTIQRDKLTAADYDPSYTVQSSSDEHTVPADAQTVQGDPIEDNNEDLNIPEDTDCESWEFIENEGVYGCTDSNSSHYNQLMYGGIFYASTAALLQQSNYHSYKNSSRFRSNSSSFSGSNGFGNKSSGSSMKSDFGSSSHSGG